MPPHALILPQSFLNHISFNQFILWLENEKKSNQEAKESRGRKKFRFFFFSKKLKQNRYEGGSPYSRSSSEVCAKFVAHRLERFQVKGYATPQPEYRDALVHAEIIFPRRPFVGTNCQLLRNPSSSSLFFFSFFFFLFLPIFGSLCFREQPMLQFLCREFKCLDRNFAPEESQIVMPSFLLLLILPSSFDRFQCYFEYYFLRYFVIIEWLMTITCIVKSGEKGEGPSRDSSWKSSAKHGGNAVEIYHPRC